VGIQGDKPENFEQENYMLISIVYDSGWGHTARQAQSVAEGVRRVADAEARLIPVAEGAIPWDVFAASDAIVFGSPTYNGAPSARFKQFCEDSTKPVWSEMKWRDKVAAGFTNSGAQNGDKLHSLISMALFAAQHGMLWVGLDLIPATIAVVAACMTSIAWAAGWARWRNPMATKDRMTPPSRATSTPLPTLGSAWRRPCADFKPFDPFF
jgi:flavorubredoxin